MEAIRSADAPGSSRTVTVPTTISGPVVSGGGRHPSGGATTIAANSTLARIPDYKITKVNELLPWHWNG